jgi:hypothetical protein
MRISKAMSRSHSRPHTSFNDLVQDLKPVSKILFNTSKTRLRSLSQDLKPVSKILFNTSKTRLRSLSQDLKPISKISLRTSNKVKISNLF